MIFCKNRDNSKFLAHTDSAYFAALGYGHSKISIITGFFLSVAFASVPNQPYCLKYEGKILNNEKFSQNASPVIAPDILGIIFPIYAKNCINLQEKINFPAS